MLITLESVQFEFMFATPRYANPLYDFHGTDGRVSLYARFPMRGDVHGRTVLICNTYPVRVVSVTTLCVQLFVRVYLVYPFVADLVATSDRHTVADARRFMLTCGLAAMAKQTTRDIAKDCASFGIDEYNYIWRSVCPSSVLGMYRDDCTDIGVSNDS